MTHLHTDHASGLKSVRGAKKILVSAAELDDTKKYPIRYVADMWQGVELEPFDFNDTGVGSVGKSFDLLGDGSIELVNIPARRRLREKILARFDSAWYRFGRGACPQIVAVDSRNEFAGKLR